MEAHHQEPTKNEGVPSETTGVVAGHLAQTQKSGPERPVYAVGELAVRVVIVYVIVAALWILVSDHVLGVLVSDQKLMMKLAMVKGWAFVAVTAALLFFLMRRETRHWTAERVARDAAEAALRESQRQMALLADMLANSSQPFAIGNPNGRFRMVNAALAELLGYTETEMLALDWVKDLTPPEWHEKEQTALAELHRTGQPIRYEKEYFRKDGTRVSVEGLVHLVRNEQGQTDYYYAFVTDLTERKQAEAALRASEERLKFAMEGANDGIWDVDMRTNTVELSPRGCEMFGYTPTEFKIDMPSWSTMVHPDDLAVTKEALSNHLSGRSSLFEVEQRLRTKTGEYKWTLSRGKVSVRDATGKPLRLTGTHTDITARRQAEVHVEHLNRVYAVLSEINQTIVRVHDSQAVFDAACRIAVEQGGFLWAWIGLVNAPTDRPSIAAQAGATPEILEILVGLISTAACGFTTQALRTGTHAVCNDITRDPAAELWREEAVRLGYRALASFPLRIEGKIIGTFNFYAGETDFFDGDELRLLDELAADISFAIEISGREERRRRMEEANARLATAVEQADEIMVITDANAEILYVNPAFEKVTGYTSQEVVGHKPSFLKSGAHDAAFYRAMWEKLTRGEVWAGRLVNKRKDGTRYEEKATISPVRDAEGRIVNYVGVKRDVTQEVAMEERLRQGQKMEAIGTLAGGIAHDFNNILGAIVGYAELTKLDTHVPAVHSGLDEILKACRRASDLVRQILTFSRQQEPRRRPLQLWPVIEEAVKLLRAALPSTITFHLEHAHDVPTVLADPTQIHQIVMNLSTNAAHAMGKRGGRFIVKLEKFEADAEFVVLHPGCQPGAYALLSISDTGHGMERGTVERIFDPFFTTKPPGEGTGLGLAVVHGIMQTHEGIITVYSRPGEGTVFNVYFPAHNRNVVEEPLRLSNAPRGNGERILVVEDEESLALMIGKILMKLGYTAEISHDPVAALAMLRAAPESYDLILTDLTMPHMTGLEFASCALEARPQTPIILMTGFSASMTSEQIRATGIKEVMIKPITIYNLGEMIDRVLKQSVSS